MPAKDGRKRGLEMELGEGNDSMCEWRNGVENE
jgi:hypothetical protein